MSRMHTSSTLLPCMFLMVLASSASVKAERVTVSGSFSQISEYSYLSDLEVNTVDKYDCGFPWGVRKSDDNCTCGNSIKDSVYCVVNETDIGSTKVGILDCSCMTWDEDNNTTVVGHCFFNCGNGSAIDSARINRVYHPINNSTNQISPKWLNEAVCGNLHRKGRLCGECKKGYHHPVYSYSPSCVKCHKSKWQNWVIFFAEAFGPLTLFLVIVMLFRVRATSAELYAYVLFCQNLTMPSNVQVILVATKDSPFVSALAKLFVSLYSVWNLDFFRSVYPPLCLGVSSMQIILLEYTIAFYPIMLLLLMYLVIKLRMYQIRGIRCIWLPVHSTMASLRRTWSLKNSVVHACATFFLLSYSKLLSISFHSVIFTRVYEPSGDTVGRYVYSDPSLKYFGPEHALYGFISLLVIIIFVISMVVLMFIYPMKWFQRVLARFHLNREFLRSFMESFQGCYKDGTNNTRDCRYFSGIYLLLRIILFTLYSITLTSLFYTFATILFISMAILIITMRPYKQKYAIYNKVDAIMILMQALSTSSILCHIFADIKGERFKNFSMFLVALFGMLPILYVIFVAVRGASNNKTLQMIGRGLKSRMIERSYNRAGEEKEELIDNTSHMTYGAITG